MVIGGTTKDPWYSVLGSAYVLNFAELIFLRNLSAKCSRIRVVYSSLALNFAVVRSIAKLCVPRK